MKHSLALCLLVFCNYLCSTVLASTPSAVDYARDIQPLLAEKCAACHGALKQEAGLRLDHGELLRQGGDAGSIIAGEQPRDSELMSRVATSDLSLRMPPEGQGEALTAEQVELLAAWLAAGAPSPDDEPIPAPPEEHWAWQPPQQAAVPAADAANPFRSDHPIDRWIMSKYQDAGLKPLEIAEPHVRLRRLYFDLIGLPPTLQEQRDFAKDTSPLAWNRLVDRLLEHPAHGERWARHWMDVWRYSDWDGYKQELRSSQRHIWRWRDWIVQSLNADKGYDRMVLEMLAADEIAPLDRDALRATGYLARNYHKSNRDIWLDATVEHTAKAFLGLTLDCARCHDHKFDPIPQTDYYAFRAIFEPHQVRTERIAGQPDLLQDGLVRAYDAALDSPTYVYIAGNEKLPDKEHPVDPGVPQVISVDFKVAPVALPPQAVFPALEAFIQAEEMAAARQRVQQAETERDNLQVSASGLQRKLAEQKSVARRAELVSLQARWAADVAQYSSGAEPSLELQQKAVRAEHTAGLELARLTLLEKQQALATALLKSLKPREDVGADKVPTSASTVSSCQKEVDAAREALRKAEVEPAADAKYTAVGTAYPATSTGRRTALARWITDGSNPLTARVAVNHVWKHYFGQPLVANVFDFGLRSPLPPHHELLDWLAVELMEHDWSLKHLQRLIVTSRVYQLASHSADEELLAANQQIDPDNHWYWRAEVRRLDAEVIRDSMLAVGGALETTLGGPDIDYELGEVNPRRSLYFRHAYEKQMTMLVLFDAAGPQECYRRSESIIPQQALALSNSPLSIDQARLLARRLWRELPQTRGADGQSAEYISAAFETLLCRPPTSQEIAACQSFIVRQTELLKNAPILSELPGKEVGQTKAATEPAARARENLIHALMNHNDFVSLR